ncbi:DASH family cryptochrome [Maribacter cobaltidurans]|uniref:Cryptochrome DASH n=1 Tax=Maribacter cobaltidurans TaxID=1178778 RepID=A0A223V754_9FLAO|nr:DASH family cryptochrome [Maribacter cobaltidurans]ASV31231.1 deoxyribodipyrimidine photolyase [Maribacter cobaltidurans]GGD83999.1 deoxyribodipyrimidine photo-lyase [Maribacter cobaltidurans]
MNNLVWFRNDLRVQDNVSLIKASKGEKVLGAYCFDALYFGPGDFGFKKTERFRAQFSIESVKELRANLKKYNIPLFVFFGKSSEHIPLLVKEHEIDTIYLQKEWTRDEVSISDSVKRQFDEKVRFNESYDQFLFHPEDIPYSNFQDIPKVFTDFRKKCEKLSTVRSVEKFAKVFPETNLVENQTKIPSLADLGLCEPIQDRRSAFPFKGGETQALQRIDHYFWQTKKLAYYKKTRNGLMGTDYSSKLSAWLANGSISARTIYWEVKKFEKKVKKNQDTYCLIFELIWRDFFKYVSLKHGPKIFQIRGILNKNYDWNFDKATLNQWTSGNTADSFVNANMKELEKTGWMSNRGRQNVASYWAKELEQDWRYGVAYFESMLIDYDVHSNWGNWMYNSGVGNDPRDRKFNTKLQAERYDANGKFQREWLQESLF